MVLRSRQSTQKKAIVGPFREEIEKQFGSPGAMPLLLDQKHWAASLDEYTRTTQNVELVAFHIDFHK